MSHFVQSSIIAIASVVFCTSDAAAQYYNPNPTPQPYAYQPVGAGLDLGLRNGGFNPSLGFGAGQVGAVAATGFGPNGLGQGLNAGVGPLGVSADVGLGRNGLGVRASSGISNTGASLEGGISGGGVGLGATTKLFGFGGGASIGVGDRGPGLGASVAFGPIGTLLIGSHRNSYPGAEQTAAHMYPGQNAAYYTPQRYSGSPSYQTAPVQHLSYGRPLNVQQSQYAPQAPRSQYARPTCPARWTC